MNIFLETLQNIENAVFAKKKKKDIVQEVLCFYTKQKDIPFMFRDSTLILRTHPMIKQQILLKKQSIIEDCKNKGVIITSIV